MHVSPTKRARLECKTTREKVCAERLFANGNKTYPKASCKSLQQVIASVQMTRCNKPDFNRLATCNLIRWTTLLQQAGKIDNLQQVCGVFGCVRRHQ